MSGTSMRACAMNSASGTPASESSGSEPRRYVVILPASTSQAVSEESSSGSVEVEKRADNVATYDARFYEGRAVMGTIAGRMTKSNKIGYIGSFPIPEVVQGINSSFIHARKVNPAVEMKVVWAYTWFSPA